MARPGFTATAEASWSYNYGDRPVVRDNRTFRPTYEPTYTHPIRVQDPMMFPDNNLITEDASTYKGPLPTGDDEGYYGHYQSRSWLAITAPTRIDRGRQFVTDLPDLGRFHTVRLQNVTGQTKVEQVLIRFKNGEEQLVKVNRTLGNWNPTLDIRVDGARKIHGFVVYGRSAHGSAYQILAL
ncbi:MAG: hypothetical protein M4D80_29885 [Myxococcota bacterium]|nr:hypothetical protein [Myxococcota bacterium]